jgi:hypothetical protein
MRAAILGSVGVGVPLYTTRCRRVPFKITGTPAQQVGSALATYAAVTANHTLDISIKVPGRTLTTYSVIFDGTENTRSLFLDRINEGLASVKAYARAVAVGVNQIAVQTTMLGSLAIGAILNTSDADVLASLGLTAADFDPSYGVRVLGSSGSKYGKSGVQYFGGEKPVFGSPEPSVHSANQHFTVVSGRCGIAVMIDRNAADTVASDKVSYKPEPQPGAG